MLGRRLLAVALLALALTPAVQRWHARGETRTRLAAVRGAGEACALDAAALTRVERLGPLLASWQTVGGCGAGASTGTGAGIKWIGRNVSGGLFHVECQGNYVKTTYGYNYVATTLVSRDLTDRWNLGVSVPWLYKFMRDPYDVGVDVANKGLGDVNVLLTRKLGPINATSLTLGIGAPTGSANAAFKDMMLPQDRQLGLGRPTASLTLDHTFDHLWGNTVLGALAAYRGGENQYHSSRVPSATGYAYSTYMLGRFAPAIGLQASGLAGHDRDRGAEQTSPLFSVAANVSLELAFDSVAILAGASLPYQYDGVTTDNNGGARSPWGWGPWIVAVGAAFAPF